jgi:hypothetical protein
VPGVGATVVHGRVDVCGLLLERPEYGVVAELHQVRLAQVLQQPLALQPLLAHRAPPPASPVGMADSRRLPR